MLTLEYQYRIDELLRQENLLTNEDLIAELTDHYSVALESRLEQSVDTETALQSINADFGGRKTLQKLERSYNRVSFRRYDGVWWTSVKALFEPKKLALLVLWWLFWAYSVWTTPQSWTSSDALSGSYAGFIFGWGLTLQKPLWDYAKQLFRRGWHNPPTEVQYLTGRMGFLVVFFWLSGRIMSVLTSYLSTPYIAILSAFYALMLTIAILSIGKVYRHLYDIDDFSWV